MKILCINYPDCAPSFIRNGWKRAFEYCGYDWRWWTLKQESAFDAFSYEPDLFIGTTYELDRAAEKCIRSRPEMKVILFASAWGDLVDGCNFPITKVQEEEKKRLAKLKEETGKPDYVFVHVTDKYLEPTMGGWRSIGIEPVGILNAYDAILYQGATYRPELACDVGFVGSYWRYKGENLDQYIMPLCYPNSGLSVKIFGAFGWPLHCYLGPCSDEINRDLMVSATVCPHVSEPHATQLGFDLPERPFKVMGVGGFCIADPVDEVREIFSEDELVVADCPEQMEGLVRFYAHEAPQERYGYIKAGQRAVWRNHTYFDRASTMLDHLNIPHNIQQKKREFFDGLHLDFEL